MSRIFSGFRSQCTILCFLRNLNVISSYKAIFLTTFMSKPLNLQALIIWYRLMLSISKVMHKWFLNRKASFIFTTCFLSSSSYLLKWSRIFNSTNAYLWNFYLFLMILRATSSLSLWSKHLKTYPKDPLPSLSKIS